MVTREETAGGGLSFTLAIGTEAIARATVDAATREYVNQLPRIIGRAVAQRYAHRLPEYRRTRLLQPPSWQRWIARKAHDDEPEKKGGA